MKKLYALGLVAITAAACNPKIEDQAQPSAGSLNFSSYLAVGNSITAGYADGSLYRSGQLNSYPNILATQFLTLGGGEFKQPLLPEGDKGYPDPKYILQYNMPNCPQAGTSKTLTPVLEERGKDSATSAQNIALTGPFNNFGIPGVRVVDYISRGTFPLLLNPYVRRMFINPTTASPLEEALRVRPTFFSVWLGSNDVLAYASAGGEGSLLPITPEAQFRFAYDSVLTALVRRTPQGVAMNIPDITSLPFFTTVPANGLVLTAEQATLLNNAYRAQNIPIRFDEGANYFVIRDGNSVRKMRAGELVLMSAAANNAIQCQGLGSTTPIPANLVLTANEVTAITTATAAFNAIINEVATAKKIPVVDMYSYLKTIQTGIRYNGIGYSASFITGGAFSLDGVHLNPRGNALAANYIIKTLNTYYGALIPEVDVNQYRGITFPTN